MSFKDLNSVERFTDRVDDYVKYRPSYPSDLLDFLNKRVHLAGAAVADIGAGTGIFTKLLLERGADVVAVEPNAKMREAALHLGAKFSDGTAEATKLHPHSLDLITCAQAFHWFEPVKTRAEFKRILKPQGLVALIWNDSDQSTPFGAAYEEIRAKFGGEYYQDVVRNTQNLDAAMETLFGAKNFEAHYFKNEQVLNLEALKGRYFSSSYAPNASSPQRAEAEEVVTNVFNKHQRGGSVRLGYTTELFLGHLL